MTYDNSAELAFLGPPDGNLRLLSTRVPEAGTDDGGLFLHTLDPAAGVLSQAVMSQQPAGDMTTATDRDGNTVIVWEDDRFGGFKEPRSTLLLATTLSRDGQLGTPQVVGTFKNCCFSHPSVAVSPTGDGHVVWIDEAGDWPWVRFRRITTTGALGPAVSLTSRGTVENFDVATYAGGRSLAVWTTHAERLLVAKVLEGDKAGRRMTLSAPTDYRSGVPEVVARGHRATVVWRYSQADIRHPDVGLRSRSVTASGIAGKVLALPRARSRRGVFPPTLTIAPAGEVFATWVGRASARLRVYLTVSK